MPAAYRKSELGLVLAFLAILSSVPIVQTGLELGRGERVQFMDAFRYQPTAKNLRQFEKTLEEKSWFQQRLRPEVQRRLFTSLQDAGAKAILGFDDWLFYRPDVRCLVEPDRVEVDTSDSKWVQPADGTTQQDSVARAIARFRDQLKARGIELLVMPVPGKPSVYPDQLTRRARGKAQEFHSPTLELMDRLQHEGVMTVDLFAVFREARATSEPPGDGASFYLARDTHWTPVGAKLAARAVAGRLRALGWAPEATREFATRRVRVRRIGDVLDMMQIPGAAQRFPPEVVECEQVSDPALGLLVPGASERPGVYRYPGQASSMLVLGDSFCRIYQFLEPKSHGELADAATGAAAGRTETTGTKRLLPGSAGFLSLLAAELKASIDSIVSDGGASTDVRRKLSTDPEILEGKRVVIWEFAERDVRLGKAGWEEVLLPPKLQP